MGQLSTYTCAVLEILHMCYWAQHTDVEAARAVDFDFTCLQFGIFDLVVAVEDREDMSDASFLPACLFTDFMLLKSVSL